MDTSETGHKCRCVNASIGEMAGEGSACDMCIAGDMGLESVDVDNGTEDVRVGEVHRG